MELFSCCFGNNNENKSESVVIATSPIIQEVMPDNLEEFEVAFLEFVVMFFHGDFFLDLCNRRVSLSAGRFGPHGAL